MNCSKVEELEDRYILGDLEEEDKASLEEHLHDCLSCATRFTASQEALGQLFAAVEPVPPPAYIKNALLEKINIAAPAQVIPIEKQIERRKRQKRLALPSIGWLAGVAAALVLGLSFWVFSLQGDLANANNRQIEAQNLLNYTSAADTRIWTMLSDGKIDPELPRARMYIRAGSDFFLVTASKMPPPPPDESYQVWMVRNDSSGKPNGKPEFVTKLALDNQGRATMVVSNPSRSADIGSCFVTTEKGNPKEPEGTKLLVWNQT